MTRTLEIPTARVFQPLLKPARHKAAWGGRGSGKSFFMGGLLIEDSMAEKGMLSVCIREVQKDLKDSSKRLLEKLLIEHRLGEADGFKVFREKIETPGDGVMIFTGMQDHTAESIKSLQGFKRAWWEEAQSASKRSISLLTPTIREKGSQLLWSWNARRKNDPVDIMFRGPQIPTNSVVVNANWRDNPWFNDSPELEQERLDCLRIEPDQYGHIWEGDYVTINVGAYYAKHLTDAKTQSRIGNQVARDPLMTIRAFWDIGGTGKKSDACSIWIGQFIGTQIRFLDYYEAQGQELSVHVAWLRQNGYGDALCHLPHDGRQNDKVYDVSYESALIAAGFKVDVVTNQGAGAALERVEAARRLFPSMYFDPKTQAGLDAIGWYHEKRDEARNLGLGPDHDWSSHGADAFGLAAVVYEMPKAERKARVRQYQGAGSWMA